MDKIYEIKEGEIIIPIPSQLPSNCANISLSSLIAASESNGNIGIARGPLVQNEYPKHIHWKGGPWTKGLTDKGKICWF